MKSHINLPTHNHRALWNIMSVIVV